MTIVDGKVSLKHLVTMETLSNEEVLGLIQRGLAFKKGESVTLSRKYYASNLFFEDSTRTHKSFEMAELRLDMGMIDFDARTSSVNKGETLYDTILTMSALGVDICVIRHSEVDYYKQLIDSPSIQTSIVNGGDGSGQHPSQSLLDLMTIYEEFGTFENLKIAIAGDITHSRVAKSNMQILKRLGADIYFTGPEEWYSAEFDVYGQHVAIDDIVEEVDVLMLLRVQHERHDGSESFSKETYNRLHGLTGERYKRLKEQAIVMHPAPVNRDVEIDDQLVEAPKSRIVRQMQNGVFVRMAILEAIVNGKV
ncbi:TPA: aspartate carbamoyltransferase catalytic subunit [Streptococcus suis]|uniref:Aspartate carbamoyltransferase n=1 Tax=Streptococcus suis TaxID=1307 RepID=A0A426TC33_STRSU|nr:aspartate carbamoyltransferase catalytic subunit [Streptococcus suis]NQH34628.1 aspartate carbamoyltransferase catalytic subunit [Streptococcus suis]NQH95794.1 aspartate carbamoyltransferase catalytic subunit [Streptococcus suis]NQM37823.1 aspartate carbamoyltransferase catalytic subunit [Streptococcus suis]NQO46388.1 aspartate carbamoyltransferase catalytic subunit [Streptococcus suis]RRR51729.1 aspartate carbamoyltransferase catalytic subunit [Streptococcus suis]